MGSTNPFGGEGYSLNRPPLFSGEGYAYWKVRMKIFIQAIDNDIWKAIEKGPHIPSSLVEGVVTPTPEDKWKDDDRKKVQYDYKAKNIITSALSYDEFFRVSQCSSAKEMWDTLQVTHEGTSEVRRARLNALMREYELFTMLPNESIHDMQKRFTHIINALLALGKTFLQGELSNKVLRCLDRTWQPKVTAIIESKDLDALDLATLFGKLQEHEMELGRLSINEESDKNKERKGLALKVNRSYKKKESSDDDDSDDSDSDVDPQDMKLMLREFDKFLKRKGRLNKNKHKEKDSPHYKTKTTKEGVVCHECGKPGHLKYSCSRYLKKKEKDKKNSKSKRAYIVWDSDEDGKKSTSSSSSDNEEAACLNLLVQVNEEESSNDESSEQSEESDVSLTKSEISSKYELLHNAYEEMYEQLEKVVKKNIKCKKLIEEHQQKILELQKQVDDLNLDNETLHLIIDNSSCDCANRVNVVVDCEDCKLLKDENAILKNKLASFTSGNVKLRTLLNFQRGNSNKFGLGYTNAKSKPHRNVVDFSKVDFSNAPTCFYCGTHGHTSNVCYVKVHGIPKGNYVWMKKGESPYTNKNGSKTIWIPKSKA